MIVGHALLQAASAMETDGHEKPPASAADTSAVGLLPEVEAYAYLLVVLLLVDGKHFPEVRTAVCGVS